MTQRALEAAAILTSQGISAAVLHMPTLKPFDADAVAALASRVDRLVTAENHVCAGGLASQVAEVLFDHGLIRRLARIGLPDAFIECGSVPHLQAKYGILTEHVVQAAAQA